MSANMHEYALATSIDSLVSPRVLSMVTNGILPRHECSDSDKRHHVIDPDSPDV
jgi:hypothetical protein